MSNLVHFELSQSITQHLDQFKGMQFIKICFYLQLQWGPGVSGSISIQLKHCYFAQLLLDSGYPSPGIFNSLQSELKKKSLKFLDAFTEASIKLKKMESNQLRTGRKSYSANGGLIG